MTFVRTNTSPTRAATILLALGLFAMRAAAEADSPVDKINAEAERATVKTEALRGKVSLVAGSGGNIAVLVGQGRKLMVDAGIGVSQQKLESALAGLGAGRVQYLINTHWHWDHTDGNDWLNEAGAEILAHANTRAHLGATIRVEDWMHTFSPVAPGGRPTSIVNHRKTIDFDGERVSIRYYGPAHTDGDLSVYFEEADVLVTGDTFWNGAYPFIDTACGGSIDGMIKAADTNLRYATDKTLIVPGHGAIASRAQLLQFRAMLVSIRGSVARLKSEGKSLEQVIAAKPTAAFDEQWGSFVIDPAFFTRLVYRGV
jgi:glyoxylase-like metal-dependent hydrolase (beta-lactamase superfamily II)